MNINFKKLGIASVALFALALSSASVNKASAKMLKTTSIPAAYRGNWQARYNEAGRRSTASARLYAHSGNVHFPSALISGKMDYTRAGHNYALYPAKNVRRGKVNSDVVQPVNMHLRHRRLNIGEGGTGLTWNMYRARIRHQVRYRKNRASKRRYTKKRVRKPRRTYKKRVRRHAYKAHKRYKKRTVKRAKLHYRHHKVTRVARKHSNIKRYVKQVQAKSVKDVNHDRATKGENPLSESSWLDHIASQRAKQLASHFSHTNKRNQGYFEIDFDNDGYSWPDTYSDAENIAYNSLGDIVTNGHESYNKNGIDIANAMNDGYFYHDANSNWGHRKNILNNNLSEIGVGAYYDKKSHRFYQAEDFWGGDDPTSDASDSESNSDDNNTDNETTTDDNDGNATATSTVTAVGGNGGSVIGGNAIGGTAGTVTESNPVNNGDNNSNENYHPASYNNSSTIITGNHSGQVVSYNNAKLYGNFAGAVIHANNCFLGSGNYSGAVIIGHNNRQGSGGNFAGAVFEA